MNDQNGFRMGSRSLRAYWRLPTTFLCLGLIPSLATCGGKSLTGPLVPPPPAKLAFTVHPGSTVAGVAISPAVQVSVQDANGNLATTSTATITLALASGTGAPGAALGGTLTQSASGGTASFAGLSVDKAAAGYRVTATAPSLASATSATFSVEPGPAATLVITGQPTTVVAGTAIAPAVQVTVQDALGNTVTGSTNAATLSITPGTGVPGATLGGTPTQAAVGGIAAFPTLTVDKVGVGYTLTATAAGLTSATSSAFAVNVGAPFKLGFTVQPGTAVQGALIAPPVQVTVQDAQGNIVATSSASLSLAITNGTGSAGALMSGTLSQASTNGVSSFDNLRINLPGVGYTLTATAANLANATSSVFAVGGGTISGTISLVSTFLAPRFEMLVAAPKQPRVDAPPGAAASARVAGTDKIPGRTTHLRAPFQTPGPRAQFVSDELIVTYRAEALGVALPSAPQMSVSAVQAMGQVVRQRATAAAQLYRATVLGVSPALRAARLRIASVSDRDQVMAALRLDPRIAAVERNGILYTTEVRHHPESGARLPVAPPNDPAYPRQAWHYEAMDLRRAWRTSTGSTSVLVAVVDDGIRFDHPGIAANLTADGYDFVSSTPAPACSGGVVDLAGDGNGYDSNPTIPVAYDYNEVLNCYSGNTGLGGHGLHVAGTIGAAGNDGVGGTGVNWAVRIRPVRVMNSAGQGDMYDIAQGILYAAGLPADNGAGGVIQAPTAARIINLSLGAEGPPNVLLQNAVAAATAAGSLLIAAAGNKDSSAPSYPAAFPEVVSVSAIGPDFTRASYSNYGPTVDIAGPGGDLADGGSDFGVYSTRWNFGTNSPDYESIQGTSMAAPHVAGVAALLLAQAPSLTASQLRGRLLNYAVDLGVPGRDDLYGAGLVNARNSLTQSMGWSAGTYARLYNAGTGAVVRDVTVVGNGTYSFTQIAAGTYWLFGGQDEDGDGRIGVPGHRWSSAGGTATPLSLTVSGALTQSVNFNLGYGYEQEPNNSFVTADALTLGGYLFGYASSSDADYSTVLIPVAGQYTFETSPFRGACGFALEADTILEIYNSNGVLVGSNDDIDLDLDNFCSRVTVTLSPGRYYLAVRGFVSTLRSYYVSVREGQGNMLAGMQPGGVTW